MNITFSKDKTHILFNHSDQKEASKLFKLPAFVKYELVNAVPAILPVAFNVIRRCQNEVKSLTLTEEVNTWINQPFKLRPIPESFKYHTTPKDFQELSLRFIYTVGSGGLLLDPGMGKSKVVLDYIYLMQFKLTFVVCPSALLFVWEDEIAKHRPELSYYTLKSTDWEEEIKGIQGLTGNGVVILNYDKAVILKHRIKELKIDFIHLDEFLIKDPKTSRTQSMLEIGRGIPYRCGGSGTLVNNSSMDIFSPIRFLQPSLVGHNYSTFLNKYAVMKETRVAEGQTRKVPVAFRGVSEMRSILESCSIVLTKEEWLKLPPKHFHDIYVQMGQDQKQAYYDLLKNYYASIQGEDLLVDNALVMLSKLYQIAQGFVYIAQEPFEEVESELLAIAEKKLKPKKKTIFFETQPKIKALEELLSGKLNNTKAIIWFNMDAEFQLISTLLDKMKLPFISIRGGDKKIGDKVREFNRSTSVPYLLCQAKSVNYGITVLGTKKKDLEDEGVIVFPGIDPSVCNQVFYSQNFSLEVFLQQQDRIHRLGQEHDCHYWRIFANCSVEARIRQALEEKISLKREMLIDVANTLLVNEESSILDIQ